MAVTPDFTGQYYRDTDTGNIWVANSTTPGDWTLVVQDFKLTWLPRTIDLTNETAINIDSGNCTATQISSTTTELLGFAITNCDNLISVSFPNLLHVDSNDGDSLTNSISNCSSIQTVSIPNLVDISGGLSIGNNDVITTLNLGSLQDLRYGPLLLSDMALLAAISIPNLTHIGDGLEIKTNSALTQINLSGLVSVELLGGTSTNQLVITDCPLLTSIDISSFLPINTMNSQFSNNALTLACVDAILARFVAEPTYISGTISLQGGTNSAPTTGAGSSHDILVARGVNIQHN